MALSEKIIIDKIEVLENNSIQIRQATITSFKTGTFLTTIESWIFQVVS